MLVYTLQYAAMNAYLLIEWFSFYIKTEKPAQSAIRSENISAFLSKPSRAKTDKKANLQKKCLKSVTMLYFGGSSYMFNIWFNFKHHIYHKQFQQSFEAFCNCIFVIGLGSVAFQIFKQMLVSIYQCHWELRGTFFVQNINFGYIKYVLLQYHLYDVMKLSILIIMNDGHMSSTANSTKWY